MSKTRFVVHRHQATRLHFDFRLEMDGVLKSWAVPKGLPEISGVRRLAVAVPDHMLEYIDFEGEIPEGEYGAGTVEIWDSGDYDLLKRTANYLEFNLRGKKIKGVYTMFNTRDKNWIVLKKTETKG